MTSGGNNFNDFPENQLTIDFTFLCMPTWRNATVSHSPCPDIIWGNGVPPKNIWGNGVPPRLHHWYQWTTHAFISPAHAPHGKETLGTCLDMMYDAIRNLSAFIIEP